VFAVDGQNRRVVLARDCHNRLTCGDQHLFGGERDGLARLQRGDGWLERNCAAERDDDDIHLRALRHRAQPLHASIAHL
jgi:hypothetical protein